MKKLISKHNDKKIEYMDEKYPLIIFTENLRYKRPYGNRIFQTEPSLDNEKTKYFDEVRAI